MTHYVTFKNILKEFDDTKVIYAIIRGFSKLPKTADSDLDIVIQNTSFDVALCIISKYCYERESVREKFRQKDKTLLYKSFQTNGPKDRTISNGCFQLDVYNYAFCYEGGCITLPSDQFHKYFFETRILSSGYFFIPSPECEIFMLLMRDIYDHKGKWQKKHTDRIKQLSNDPDKLKHLFTMIDSSTRIDIIKHTKKALPGIAQHI